MFLMRLRVLSICLSCVIVLVGLMGCKASAPTSMVITPTATIDDSYPTCLEFITPGSDGNLWFTDAYRNTIAKISPKSGKVTEYNTPTSNSNPIYIAKGPDGNLWFTESNNNATPPVKKIGKMSPSTGEITEYSVPMSDPSQVFFGGLTTGPDGNMWFTSPYENKIGKISPMTGEITEYNVPFANSNPRNIIALPDGNLWFTTSNENTPTALDKISPITGDITVFNIATADANLPGITYITIGSDGNLWFTDPPNKIGKLSLVTGDVSEYNVPTENSYPLCITAGPDGNLWFSESYEGKIGKISPATDIITEYNIPNPGNYPNNAGNIGPFSITTGPDGNLWFVERVMNIICKISPKTNNITEYSIPH